MLLHLARAVIIGLLCLNLALASFFAIVAHSPAYLALGAMSAAAALLALNLLEFPD